MVAGGYMTESPSSITYSSVVSIDSLKFALTIAALNGLSIFGCDIQNAYLTAPCREKISKALGPSEWQSLMVEGYMQRYEEFSDCL